MAHILTLCFRRKARSCLSRWLMSMRLWSTPCEAVAMLQKLVFLLRRGRCGRNSLFLPLNLHLCRAVLCQRRSLLGTLRVAVGVKFLLGWKKSQQWFPMELGLSHPRRCGPHLEMVADVWISSSPLAMLLLLLVHVTVLCRVQLWITWMIWKEAQVSLQSGRLICPAALSLLVVAMSSNGHVLFVLSLFAVPQRQRCVKRDIPTTGIIMTVLKLADCLDPVVLRQSARVLVLSFVGNVQFARLASPKTCGGKSHRRSIMKSAWNIVESATLRLVWSDGRSSILLCLRAMEPFAEFWVWTVQQVLSKPSCWMLRSFWSSLGRLLWQGARRTLCAFAMGGAAESAIGLLRPSEQQRPIVAVLTSRGSRQPVSDDLTNWRVTWPSVHLSIMAWTRRCCGACLRLLDSLWQIHHRHDLDWYVEHQQRWCVQEQSNCSSYFIGTLWHIGVAGDWHQRMECSCLCCWVAGYGVSSLAGWFW